MAQEIQNIFSDYFFFNSILKYIYLVSRPFRFLAKINVILVIFLDQKVLKCVVHPKYYSENMINIGITL